MYVGEEMARSTENKDSTTHLDRFLKLMGHRDCGFAPIASEFNEGLAERR